MKKLNGIAMAVVFVVGLMAGVASADWQEDFSGYSVGDKLVYLYDTDPTTGKTWDWGEIHPWNLKWAGYGDNSRQEILVGDSTTSPVMSSGGAQVTPTVTPTGIGQFAYCNARYTGGYYDGNYGHTSGDGPTNSFIADAITEKDQYYGGSYRIVYEFTLSHGTNAWGDGIDIYVGKFTDYGAMNPFRLNHFGGDGGWRIRTVDSVWHGGQDLLDATWYDIKVEINPAANSGDGDISLFYRYFGDTAWTAFAGIQNIDLQLSLVNDAVDTPDEWEDIYTDLEWAAIADMKAYSIPEPATISLLVLGGIGMLVRKRRRS